MSDSRYREEAVKSHNSRDEFGKPIRIISPPAWVSLFIFCLLFIAGFIWLIFGSISTITQGPGMVFAKNSQIINVMSPISGGYVKQLLVYPGQAVKQGQLLATLVNPNISAEIKELRNYIAKQTAKLNELSATAKQEIDTRSQQIAESIKETETSNNNLLEKFKQLDELLKTHEAAFKKGIVSRLELTSVQVAFYDTKEQITKNQKTLIELKQSKNDYIETWESKIRDLQQKLTQSNYDLEKLREKNELTESVVSPVDGVVGNSFVKQGDFLTEKQTLTNVITYSKELEVVAFFNDEVGKKIKVGMPAKVFLNHIDSLEYGSINGKVYYISELPVSPKSLESLWENQKLVEEFMQKGPVFEVKIELVPSKNTKSGYLWSTSKGPDEKISIGTTVNVGVVTKKARPISVILRIFKAESKKVIDENE